MSLPEFDMRNPQAAADAAVTQIMAASEPHEKALDLLILAARFDWDVFGHLIFDAIERADLAYTDKGTVWNAISDWLGPLHLTTREAPSRVLAPALADDLESP